jgi:hypothetical protein
MREEKKKPVYITRKAKDLLQQQLETQFDFEEILKQQQKEDEKYGLKPHKKVRFDTISALISDKNVIMTDVQQEKKTKTDDKSWVYV